MEASRTPRRSHPFGEVDGDADVDVDADGDADDDADGDADALGDAEPDSDAVGDAENETDAVHVSRRATSLTLRGVVVESDGINGSRPPVGRDGAARSSGGAGQSLRPRDLIFCAVVAVIRLSAPGRGPWRSAPFGAHIGGDFPSASLCTCHTGAHARSL